MYAYSAAVLLEKPIEKTEAEKRVVARHLLHAIARGHPQTAEDEIRKLLELALIRLEIYLHAKDRRSLNVALRMQRQAEVCSKECGVPLDGVYLLLTMGLLENFAEIHEERRGPEGAIAMKLGEGILRQVGGVPPPELAVDALIHLARVYSDWPEGAPQENFDAAVTLLQSAIDQLNAIGADPERLAEVMVELAYTYGTSRKGYEPDNTELSISILEEARGLVHGTAATRLRGNIEMYLGDGYTNRVRGDRIGNLRVAADHLEAAAKIFLATGVKNRATRALARFNQLTPRIAALETQTKNRSASEAPA
ncbi:hypothetical protein [Maricaulis sp. W15]|uniref:hypothetical protein n=1 Tax=Maricaulis sp. W15 TaxID=1772333 RepID=UPI0011814879|nr:hypothetical protein [Maricaulis sp. W15]